MFVGRQKELDGLNKQFSSGPFEMTVVYGRRRVGKTTMIKEFVKEKSVNSNVKQINANTKDGIYYIQSILF